MFSGEKLANEHQIYRLLAPISQTNQYKEYLDEEVFDKMIDKMKENYWRTESFDLLKSPYLKYYNKYGKCFYYEKRGESERSTYHKS